jgi:hypothetical protein
MATINLNRDGVIGVVQPVHHLYIAGAYHDLVWLADEAERGRHLPPYRRGRVPMKLRLYDAVLAAGAWTEPTHYISITISALDLLEAFMNGNATRAARNMQPAGIDLWGLATPFRLHIYPVPDGLLQRLHVRAEEPAPDDLLNAPPACAAGVAEHAAHDGMPARRVRPRLG